jgi:thiol-disulfide isomerase/thioredoxin
MKHPGPTLLTVVLSVVTLIAYGAYRVLGGSFDSADTANRADAAAASLADSLPAFTLADLDGRPVAIESFADQPLVINFWATWCGPCLREIPLLKQFQAEHPALSIIGIAVDRPDAVRAFADEMQFNYPVLVGQADAMDAATRLGIGVFVLPSTVFTAAGGATLGIHVGEIHAEHLDDLTATLAALGRAEIDLDGARARLAGLR